MKRLKPLHLYVLLGVVVVIVPVKIIDYILRNAFLTPGGYLSNSVVAKIIAYQLTQFQAAFYGFVVVLVVGIPIIKDFSATGVLPYRSKNYKRSTAICVGTALAGIFLLLPFMNPQGYQHILGFIITPLALLILQHQLSKS